jgi:hypothetical protein
MTTAEYKIIITASGIGQRLGDLTKYTGSTNTGGGGGGFGGGSFTPSAAGKGGSGIVAIRYTSPYALGIGGTITTSGSYIYHTFTATGSSTFTVF